MVEFLETWIITLLISIISDKMFMLEMHKIVANYGYKSKCANINDMPYQVICISKDITLIPIINILARMYAYARVKRNIPNIVEKLINLDIVEKMTDKETKLFDEKPNGIRAAYLYIESIKKKKEEFNNKKKIQSIDMTIDGKKNNITYRMVDNELEIIKVDGPIAKMGYSKEELEKIILECWEQLFVVCYRLYPETFEEILEKNNFYEINNIGYENDDRELKVTDLYFKYDINELDKLSDYMTKYDTEDVIEHSKTLCKKKK